MKFINRELELELLNSEFCRQESSLVVIFGRRRTGKTTLLNHFLENKKSLYYFADTQSEKNQIRRFQESLAETFADNLLNAVKIDSWDVIFDYLCQKINTEEKFVLAIDEFQSLVKANLHFSSLFQRIYDTKLKKENIMIILCGSIIGMMYNETLSYNSPLYGRRTAQIKLKEIDFHHYQEFYPELGKKELIEFFTITGGIPKYIELFRKGSDLFSTIRTEILNKNKFLYYEPRFLLQEEVNDVSTYFSILTVISAGNHKMNTITGRLGVQASQITVFLKKLMDLDIIEKQIPVTEENPSKSKRGLYFIKDNFLQFWFRFVFPYQSYLEIDNLNFVENKIREDLVYLVSGVFEKLCRQVIFEIDLPLILEKCGRWWDKQNEIDLVGINSNDEIIFGECKWSDNLIGLSVLRELQAKAGKVAWGSNKRKEYYILFSKSGFTDDLKRFQEDNHNIFLIIPDQF